MRKTKEIDNEIKKLRLVFNGQFPEKAKDNAWAMMLALQLVKTTHKTLQLSPMELSGITMGQANAVKKTAKRVDLPKFSITTRSNAV